MPRRRKLQTEGTIELAKLPASDQPEFVPLSVTEERRERELEEILDQLGTDARIKVWQIIDGKSSYAGDMSADGFTLDALLEAFGGGDKSLVIMQGKTRVEKVSVSLDPSIPPKNPRMPKVVPGQPQNNAVDMSNMFAMMAKSSMDNAQMMTSVMTGIVTALTAVMSAGNKTDPIQQAIQIANVLKPAGGGAGGMAEAMAVLRQGIELGERFNGGDRDDDGVMSVVGKGMDTLAVIVNGIVTERKAAAARGLNAGPGPGASAPVHESATEGASTEGHPAPEGTVTAVRPWVDAVRPNMNNLIQASRFLSPRAAAVTIADSLEDDQFFDLIDDIQDQSNGGFGVRIKTYFPGEIDKVSPEWLGEVLTILLTEHLEDQAAGDDEPEQPPTGETNGTP